MKRMMTVLVVLGALFSGSQALMAQIASPSLFPGGFNSTNPAVIQWGAPSRVGLIYGQEEVTPAAGPTATGERTIAGARLVGDFAAIAVTRQTGASNSNAQNLKQELTQAGLSFKPFDWLAVGGSYLNIIQSDLDNSKTGVEFEVSQTTMGASMKMGDMFYLGVGQSEDKAKFDLLILGTTVLSEKTGRKSRGYGVGLLAGGNVKVRLEAAKTEAEPLVILGATVGHQTGSRYAGELAIGSLVFFAEGAGNTDLSAKEEEKNQTIGIGWVPQSGLSAGVAVFQGQKTDTVTGNIIEESKVQFMTVSFLF